jgi:hypothetical protein
MVVTIAIRATPLSSPPGHWFFTGWPGGTCHSITAEGYCTLQSPIFGIGDFSPLVTFDDLLGPTITSNPVESYSDVSERTVTIGFAYNEPVDATCRFDGGSFVACTSGITPFTFNEGDHTVDMRATDKSGNLSLVSSQRTFKIVDTSINGGPENGSVSGPSPSFAYSTVAGLSYDCALDGSGFSDCGSQPFHGFTGLSDGQHTFYVRAKNGGYFDHVPATRTWTVDATPPQTSITDGPPNKTKSKSALITFSADESATFACSLDGAGESPCMPPMSLTNLGLGTHLFTVRATDSYGNVDSTPATFSWTVDYKPPDTKVTKGPAAKTKAKTAKFKFTSTEANSTFQCKLDRKAWKPCTSGVTYRGLKKGKHTFQVKGADALGNVDASPAKKSWTIK